MHVKVASLQEFDEDYKECIVDNFKLKDNHDYYVMKDMLQNNVCNYVKICDGVDWIGYALVFVTQESDVAWVVLLKLRDSYVGKFGKRALLQMLSLYANTKHIYFTIKDPLDYLSRDDKLAREEEFLFYRDNGCLRDFSVDARGTRYRVFTLDNKPETTDVLVEQLFGLFMELGIHKQYSLVV